MTHLRASQALSRTAPTAAQALGVMSAWWSRAPRLDPVCTPCFGSELYPPWLQSSMGAWWTCRDTLRAWGLSSRCSRTQSTGELVPPYPVGLQCCALSRPGMSSLFCTSCASPSPCPGSLLQRDGHSERRRHAGRAGETAACPKVSQLWAATCCGCSVCRAGREAAALLQSLPHPLPRAMPPVQSSAAELFDIWDKNCGQAAQGLAPVASCDELPASSNGEAGGCGGSGSPPAPAALLTDPHLRSSEDLRALEGGGAAGLERSALLGDVEQGRRSWRRRLRWPSLPAGLAACVDGVQMLRGGPCWNNPAAAALVLS